MAGHSKWNNIKNRKGAEDIRRGKVFSQLSKAIRSAVKEGGSGDPKANASLRIIMDKARAANMPKDKIQRAIDRGLGKTAAGAQLQEIMYEGFGPGGVGFLIVAVTDNPNRTSSEMKFILSRAGGTMAGPGAASFLFTRQPGNEYVATMPMVIDAPEEQQKLQGLLDTLREHDDVEDVFCAANWEGKE